MDHKAPLTSNELGQLTLLVRVHPISLVDGRPLPRVQVDRGNIVQWLLEPVNSTVDKHVLIQAE
jgi:hypothetical protein